MKSKNLIFLTLLPFFGFSQIFSIAELMRLTSKGFDNFDTYVTSKGYSFYANHDTQDSKGKCYSFGQKDYSKMASFFITYFNYQPNSNEVLISWQTTNKANYLRVKNELKQLNFKFVKEESYEDCSNLNYKKGVFYLNLYSCQKPGDQGILSTTYEISISNYTTD